MENYPSWALVEAGRCPSCGKDEWLFTHSEASNYDDSRRTGYMVQCHQCHISRLWNDRYDSIGNERISVSRLWSNAPDVNDRNYPYMATVDRCAVCYLPLISEPVGACFADERTRIVQVHQACSTLTQCCDQRILSGFWFDSNSPLRRSALGNFTNLEGFIQCQQCLDTLLTQRGHTINEYFTCNHCDSLYHRNERQRYRGSGYCSGCYDNYVFACGECDTQVWDGDDHDCYDASDDDFDGIIHDYNYKPRPYFFGDKSKERLFFGFELEVEVKEGSRRDQAEQVQQALGERVYIKHDGSLECGFEIVSHPHTLEKLQKEFPFESFQNFRRNGLVSWDTTTCGLHVHVSRDAFGIAYDYRTNRDDKRRSEYISSRQLHEMRFIKLIYDNERQVCRIAGRKGNGYANFADKGNIVPKVKWNDTVGGRMAAVNTENETTLEVRIFKGSLNPRRVLTAVEFVHAAVEYTRDLKVNVRNKALSWLAFSGYVHTNLEKYPSLHQTMLDAFSNERAPE